jgi:hypothetical protein
MQTNFINGPHKWKITNQNRDTLFFAFESIGGKLSRQECAVV